MNTIFHLNHRLVTSLALLSALAIGLAVARTTAPVAAQNAPASQDAHATSVLSSSTPVEVASDVALPASVRRVLPRGATSLFCVAANINKRAVLLHGWNARRGNTTLDILATTGSSHRTKYVRLKRPTTTRIEPGNGVAVRVASLDAAKRGTVITLNWSQSQAAGAFSTVPMLAFDLPKGVGGSAFSQGLETESSAGGNVFYQLRADAKGRAVLVLIEEVFDAGSQLVKRYEWNGRQFVPRGEAETVPLSG